MRVQATGYQYRINRDQYSLISDTINRYVDKENVTEFEVGSRDGADAFFLSAITNKSMRIVCFDPHPAFPELAKCFALLNRRIALDARAVSDVAGRVRFYCTETANTQYVCEDLGIGASSTKKPIVNVPGLPTKDFREIVVESVSGQRCCETYGQPDVLILDVQGAELSVLQSFAEHLCKVELVFSEVNIASGMTYEGDSSVGELTGFMEKNGFRLLSAYNISRYSADVIYCRSENASKVRSMAVASYLFGCSALKRAYRTYLRPAI